MKEGGFTKTMALSTGKAFERKFALWHKGLDCYTFKFPDFASTGNYSLAICDRVTVTRRGTYWFECKHTNSKTSFSFSLIKPHQWKSMLKLEKYRPFYAYFVIEDGNHRVYLVPPSVLFKLTTTNKSVKFRDLELYLTPKKQFIIMLK